MTRDDELVERIAEAIAMEDYAAHTTPGNTWVDDSPCPSPHALARAALAVARPAIRDEVLAEVLQVLRAEWAALYALSKRIGGYDLNGAMRARDAADAVSAVFGKVEDLRDSKGDEQ